MHVLVMLILPTLFFGRLIYVWDHDLIAIIIGLLTCIKAPNTYKMMYVLSFNFPVLSCKLSISSLSYVLPSVKTIKRTLYLRLLWKKIATKVYRIFLTDWCHKFVSWAFIAPDGLSKDVCFLSSKLSIEGVLPTKASLYGFEFESVIQTGWGSYLILVLPSHVLIKKLNNFSVMNSQLMIENLISFMGC